VSEAREQHLILASILLAATLYGVFLVLSPARRTWFVKAALANTIVLVMIFATLGLTGITSLRAEVLGWMVRELPFTVMFSLVCLGQAGLLPPRLGVFPLEEAAKRPRVQNILGTAPLVLVSSWLLAGIVGVIWPLPVLQTFAPAPPHFVLTKWILTLPTLFYCAIIGWLFLKAAGPRAPTLRLRLKNLSFSVGTFAWLLMTLNSTVHAPVRVWAPGGIRETIVATQVTAQSALLAVSLLAYVFGLTLRYESGVDTSLLQRIYVGWLHAQDRFESHGWYLIKGGKIRRTVQISHYLKEAARWLGLPEEDLQKALKTIELVALLMDPVNETREITPEKAIELYRLRRVVARDSVLGSRIRWDKDWASACRGSENIESDPLHDALAAALNLLDYDAANPKEAENVPLRPLWYHLAVVGAVDAGLLARNHSEDHLEHRPARDEALTAYEVAKASANLLSVGTREVFVPVTGEAHGREERGKHDSRDRQRHH
jgi:hypothetical protein